MGPDVEACLAEKQHGCYGAVSPNGVTDADVGRFGKFRSRLQEVLMHSRISSSSRCSGSGCCCQPQGQVEAGQHEWRRLKTRWGFSTTLWLVLVLVWIMCLATMLDSGSGLHRHRSRMTHRHGSSHLQPSGDGGRNTRAPGTNYHRAFKGKVFVRTLFVSPSSRGAGSNVNNLLGMAVDKCRLTPEEFLLSMRRFQRVASSVEHSKLMVGLVRSGGWAEFVAGLHNCLVSPSMRAMATRLLKQKMIGHEQQQQQQQPKQQAMPAVAVRTIGALADGAGFEMEAENEVEEVQLLPKKGDDVLTRQKRSSMGYREAFRTGGQGVGASPNYVDTNMAYNTGAGWSDTYGQAAGYEEVHEDMNQVPAIMRIKMPPPPQYYEFNPGDESPVLSPNQQCLVGGIVLFAVGALGAALYFCREEEEKPPKKEKKKPKKKKLFSDDEEEGGEAGAQDEKTGDDVSEADTALIAE